MYEEKNILGEKMSLYDYATARNITADAQGRLMAFACGTNNLMAPVIEALSQNGYSIYANEDGTSNIVQDMDTKGGTTWKSPVFGMNFAYDYKTGSVKMSPLDSSTDVNTDSKSSNADTSSTAIGSSSGDSIFGTVSPSYNPYNQYGITGSSQGNAFDSLNDYNKAILDSYFTSRQKSDIDCNDGAQGDSSAQLDETLPDEYIKELEELAESKIIDERTGYVVNKQKSDNIDEIASNSAEQYKFDQIAKAINRVEETQNAKPKEIEKSGGLLSIIGGTIAGGVTGGLLVTAGTKLLNKLPGVGGKIAAAGITLTGAILGFFGAKVVSDVSKSDAKEIDEKSKEALRDDAFDAGNKLKKKLDGLLKEGNQEEFIAFERYYQDNYGASLSDKLRELDITDSDSEIAKQSGINSEYLLGAEEDGTIKPGVLMQIDEANKYLEPEKIANVQQEAVKKAQTSIDEKSKQAENNKNTSNYTNKEEIQLKNLYKKLDVYQNAWNAANNGSKISVDGETKTCEEIEELLFDTAEKIDRFIEAKQNGEATSGIY